jgi:phosphoglycerol transferase MdoB-like AlkP superfamily enzyme
LVYAHSLFKGIQKNDCMVQNIDIAPTLLELAGLKKSAYIPGKSFVQLLKVDSSQWRNKIFYTLLIRLNIVWIKVYPTNVTVPLYYLDNAETRGAIARQLTNVKEMGRQTGKLIQGLKNSGLYNNTVVFFTATMAMGCLL